MTEDGQPDASTNGSTRRTMAAQICSQGMNLRNENHENVLAHFSARPTRRARAYYQAGGLDECHVIDDVVLFRSATAIALRQVVGFLSEIDSRTQSAYRFGRSLKGSRWQELVYHPYAHDDSS